MIIKTIKQAEKYAKMLEDIHGEKYHIIKVQPGTAAAEWGYKFAVCPDSEKADYERDGAIFV